MLIKSTNLSQPSFKWPDDWGQGARGVWAGGGPEHEGGDPRPRGNITYVTISTLSDSVVFGDPLMGLYRAAGASGRGRGIISGGTTTVGSGSNSSTTAIHYVTIASLGNSTSFGVLTTNRVHPTSTSNGTRAIIMGGWNDYEHLGSDRTSIDYVTIATTGNATNFGNLTTATTVVSDATGDGVYGMTFCNVSGGFTVDKYDYVAIDTPGNTTLFGGIGQNLGVGMSANSNGSRAIWSGGYNGSNITFIDYLTWSTPSNAAQYGALRLNVQEGRGVEDGSRAVIGGGDGNGNGTNNASLEYFSLDLAAGSSVISAAFGTMGGSYSDEREYTAGFAG